jgi:hypothetical protein
MSFFTSFITSLPVRVPRRLPLKLVLLVSSLFTGCQVADAQRGFVDFEKFTLDESMQGGYGVEVADVDGDGLTDIIALATNPAQLAWYRNPGWEKYVISSVAERNIDAAPKDIDGDGDMDLVLASEFSLGASTEGGLIHWLENPGDPAVNQEWAMHYIDEIPTSHRIKWGDVNGDGAQELINLPIIGVGAGAPDYAVDLQMKAYPIPVDLERSAWPGVVLDQSLQLSHGLRLVDWDDDARTDILTASFGGVHLFQLSDNGEPVSKIQIGSGKQDAQRPQIGASEVDLGILESGGRFVATIEPWHGNQVVVYTAGDAANTGQIDGDDEDAVQAALWTRSVIDEGFANGHGLLVADLNNDGRDEIIAGGRSEPYQLAIFRFLDENRGWQRIDLDDGNVAVSGLAIFDLNGDGFDDIVAIGAGTSNVVYYQNTGR